MKITLLTVGSHGDIRPYLALGKGLKSAGFEVCLATHSNFKDWISGHGLDFHPVQGNPQAVLQSENGQNLMGTGTNIIRFIQQFREAAQADMLPGFDDCLQAAQGASAIVAPFFVAPVADVISRELGCKSILGYLQPTTPTGAFPVMTIPNLYFGGLLNKSSHQLARLFFWQIFREIVDNWSQLRFQRKAALWQPFNRLEKRSLVLFGFSRHLVPHPYDWPKDYHITGFWQLPEAENFQPSDELQAFLTEKPAPVYIGFGSMSAAQPEQVMELVSQALKQSQQRGLLMAGWGGMAGEVADNMLLLDACPHDWLFPRMQALVHHGGAGTTATGLSAGVPALLVPFFGDQPFWAQRVFGMGAGPRPVPRQKLTADNLAAGIRQLVENKRYAQKAQELSQRMAREGGVAEAVRLIQQFVR